MLLDTWLSFVPLFVAINTKLSAMLADGDGDDDDGDDVGDDAPEGFPGTEEEERPPTARRGGREAYKGSIYTHRQVWPGLTTLATHPQGLALRPEDVALGSRSYAGQSLSPCGLRVRSDIFCT